MYIQVENVLITILLQFVVESEKLFLNIYMLFITTIEMYIHPQSDADCRAI